jgi:hypothetical protein
MNLDFRSGVRRGTRFPGGVSPPKEVCVSTPTTGPLRQSTVLNIHSPAVISVIAVAVVALVVLGFIFVPRFGSAPSTSGEPSLSPTATLTPTVEPTPSASPATPTAAPTATVVPTPAPPASWTGLAWSEPVTPAFTVHLDDVEPWRDSYVAVGMLETDAGPAARIFSSPDGLNWTVAYDPGTDHWPRHLVARDDELLAFSQRDSFPEVSPGSIVGAPPDTYIWRSTDGVHWSLLGDWPTIPVGSRSAGWDETQYPIHPGLIDVASGPGGGLVAIGNTFAGDELAPSLLYSPDGVTWAVEHLPDAPSPILNAIVPTDGGYVVVGAVDIGPDPATAVPAAWHSADGVTWTRATVEEQPDAIARGEFGRLEAGMAGLVTCFDSREMKAGGWRFDDPWISADGSNWRRVGTSDPDHPRIACGWMDGDGERIIAIGARQAPTGQPWPGVTEAWSSFDGATWTPLTLSDVLTDSFEAFWVVPDGVIYAGVQSFWFGTALMR